MGELLEQIKDERDDLRQDRDHWRRQATHLLTNQPKPEPEAQPKPAPEPQPQQAVNQNPRRSLWATFKKWI